MYIKHDGNRSLNCHINLKRNSVHAYRAYIFKSLYTINL